MRLWRLDISLQVLEMSLTAVVLIFSEFPGNHPKKNKDLELYLFEFVDLVGFSSNLVCFFESRAPPDILNVNKSL